MHLVVGKYFLTKIQENAGLYQRIRFVLGTFRQTAGDETGNGPTLYYSSNANSNETPKTG